MADEDRNKLRVLVVGAGAIGSYVGGSLVLDGQELAFIEREHNAPALKKSGIRLTDAEGKRRSSKDIEVYTSIEKALEGEPYDVAIFALKSFDTADAMDDLKPFAEKLPPFLCLQNGVDNEGVIAAALGEEKVIPATITTAVSKSGPGEVKVDRERGVGISGAHPRGAQLAEAFKQAGIKTNLYATAGEMKWSKLLGNLLVNASSAILDMTPAEILEDERLFKLEMIQLREALAVMDAIGLRVVDLPGLPVRALAFAARNLNLKLARPLMARAVGRGRGDKMPSLHIDLHSGRERSEVEWLNGAVVRYGEELEVETPVNRTLNETLLDLVKAKSPKALTPEDLYDKLRNLI